MPEQIINIMDVLDWWKDENDSKIGKEWGLLRFNVDASVLDALKEAVDVIEFARNYKDDPDGWFDDLQERSQQWVIKWCDEKEIG